MRRLLAALLLLCLATGLNGCSPEPPRPNVLLITLDTTRPDHLSCYGYGRPTSPALDALAARGVRFDNAWAGSAETGPSLATVLTSRRPPAHGVRANAERLHPDVRTFAEEATEHGYATGAFVSTVLLKREHSGFDRGFAHYDDTQTDPCFGHDNAQRIAERTIDAARTWIAGTDGPYFAWVHLYDPHGPYLPPTRAQRLDATRAGVPNTALRPGDVPGYQRVKGVTDSADYVDRYDHEIAYMDAQLQRLFASIDPETTVIAVHADHGEALGEDGYWFRHGSLLHDPALRIPLILAGPGVPTFEVDSQRMCTLDIAPTLVGLLGWDGALPDAEGLKWRPAPGRGRPAPVPRSLIAEARVRERVRDGTGIDIRWKVRIQDDAADPVVDAVWWPRADERWPVSTSEAVIERMKAWLKPPLPLRGGQSVSPSPELDPALKALGYK